MSKFTLHKQTVDPPAPATDKLTVYHKASSLFTIDEFSVVTDLNSVGNVIGPGSSTDNAMCRFDGATGELIQNSGIIVDDANCMTGVGCVDMSHTATVSDDHALEITADAAGFGDVNAIHVIYTSGAIGAGDDEEVVLLAIDESASTGGRIAGVGVAATGLGSAVIDGLDVAAGVNPVRQFSGTFGDLDSILVLAVSKLTELSGGGAGNVTVFVADNDTITVGDAAQFQELEFDVATPASGPGVQPTFEFSTGVGTWAVFTPADGTNGFKNTGVVIWSLDDIPSWAIGTGSEFLIRITRTQNTLATVPILDMIQRATGAEYLWDKDGVLDIAGLLASMTIRDPVDKTKEVQFDVSAVATATKRTITMPDADVVLGGGGSFPIYVVNPRDTVPSLNADWAVNAFAELVDDSNNAAMQALLFDDTGAEGAGLRDPILIPMGATNMKVDLWSHAEVAPGSELIVKPVLYFREIKDNLVVPSWSAKQAIVDVAMPVNVFPQKDTVTKTLASWGLTEGKTYGVQIVRDTVGNTYLNDWAFLQTVLCFT